MNVLAASALSELSRMAGSALPAGGSIGVRPEGVRVHPSPNVGAIKGRVQLVESLGSDTLIYCDVGSGTSLVARQSDRSSLQPGDSVGIDVDPDALHLFDQNGRTARNALHATKLAA
jgi:multiple sugar transport system ATP-binding protein